MIAIYFDWQLTRPCSFAGLRNVLSVRALSRDHYHPLLYVLEGFAKQHGIRFDSTTTSLYDKCARCREYCALMEIVDAVSRVGVVAGSFALYAYLIRSGQRPGWFPKDIDVFVPAQADTLCKVIDELEGSKIIRVEASSDESFPYPTHHHVHTDSDMPYPMDSSFVDRATVRKFVSDGRQMSVELGWSQWNWDELLRLTSIDDLAPNFKITNVGMLDTSLKTVDGTYARDINVIFTDVATLATGRSITDNFDLACCAFSCTVLHETLVFDFRDIAYDAVVNRKMLLMPRAFRGFVGFSNDYSIWKQLKRIRKYASRGFEIAMRSSNGHRNASLAL